MCKKSHCLDFKEVGQDRSSDKHLGQDSSRHISHIFRMYIQYVNVREILYKNTAFDLNIHMKIYMFKICRQIKLLNHNLRYILLYTPST